MAKYTCRPDERGAWCNGCSKQPSTNEMKAAGHPEAPGPFFELALHLNENQRSVLTLCASCLQDLHEAIHPHLTVIR